MMALDNYEPPSSVLSGRVVWEGRPIGVRSNGVQLELWQPGFELNQKIPIYVSQDGSFSAVLFDGRYKLNLLAGNGPWVDSQDTILIDLKGRAEVDVPVRPYYTIEQEVVGYRDGQIEATFRIGQVETSRALEYVGLYVSTTSFVDRTNMVVRNEVPRSALGSLDDPVQLSVALTPALLERENVFVRIGVKTVGVAELLFSPVYKVSL